MKHRKIKVASGQFVASNPPATSDSSAPDPKPQAPDPIHAAQALYREHMQRILEIHTAIKAGTYPNCTTLAAKLGVTRRTIKRDIQYLLQHHRLPIEYHPQKHGYYYTMPVKAFQNAPLATEADIFALLVAHKAIAQYHGTPFHEPLKLAFQKFITHLDTKERYSIETFQDALSFRPFAPEDADLRVFQAVTQALKERRVLAFQYRKPGTKTPDSRRVHPYHITCADNRWYLLAHDLARGDIRTFVLGRITLPQVTGEHFVKPLDFNADKYLRGSFTVMKGAGDHQVIIEFDPWSADIVRGRQWHSSQEFTDLPDGRSRMTMRLSGLEEVERWVLSWGTHATVIAPPALAERLGSITATLAQRYAPPFASAAPIVRGPAAQ